MKAQASIEYIFSLIIFLSILITVASFYNIKTKEVEEIQKNYKASITSQKFLESLKIITYLGKNSSTTFVEPPNEIIKFEVNGQEIFFLDEKQPLAIYYIPSARISKTIGKLGIINVKYYGENISISSD
ncbi:MAG: hypothetical protein QXV64_02595 [Candidatus Anstonellaceae archaeon]